MPAPAQTLPSRTRNFCLAAGLVLSLVAAAVGLGAYGRHSRHGCAPADGGGAVEVVRTGHDAVALWRARGCAGQPLVHAGRFLHFVPPEDADAVLRDLVGRRGAGARYVCDRMAAEADWRGYLFAAVECDVARSIEYVLPQGELRARAEDVGEAVDGDGFLALPTESFPRRATEALRLGDEPALVAVHASWFERGNPAALLEPLAAARVRPTLVTVVLAEDSPDVAPAAREAAAAFATTLASRLARRPAP
ncbi:MAG TPA: hypothetical protein VF875_13400 [Anaeromyxobacter sp.]